MCFTSTEYLSLLHMSRPQWWSGRPWLFRHFNHHTTSIRRARGVAQSPREPCQLYYYNRLSDLLSHNQLEVFYATFPISYTTFFLSFPINPICLMVASNRPIFLPTAVTQVTTFQFLYLICLIDLDSHGTVTFIMISSFFPVENITISGLTRISISHGKTSILSRSTHHSQYAYIYIHTNLTFLRITRKWIKIWKNVPLKICLHFNLRKD